ncbi:MAG: MFS transporter [Burkholderiaceae bacterium]|nr:MFS transporter [Burkholderiaceae bacterium]
MSGSMAASADRPSRVRWIILAILFVATTINFADRATMSFAGPEMQKLLGLSPVQMGFIFSAFAWSYVAMQLPGGWLLDRYGSRNIYFCSILLWSLLTAAMGFAGGFAGASAVAFLFGLRLLIGAAEAPSFPGNSRIATAWFPTAERGMAAAIFNSAQYFATVLFAPLMGWLVHIYGWQSMFYTMGGLGVAMAFVWKKTVYGPQVHPRVNAAELAYIQAGGALTGIEQTGQAPKSGAGDSWAIIKQLLANRMLLGVYIGQYCITTLTYFFLTWFPVYLVNERHMTILKAGFLAALPAVAGFVGGILGGVVSDRMIERGFSLSVARKTPIVAGLLLSMAMIVCNYVSVDWIVIAMMSLAFFGKGVGALGWAVVSDTSPREAGGLSGGLFNTFGNAAGITTPIVIGYILQNTGSFSGALVFVGANAAAAIFSYLFIVGEIRRVELRKPELRKPETDSSHQTHQASEIS